MCPACEKGRHDGKCWCFERGGYNVCNLFPRLASSTPRDWSTLAVYTPEEERCDTGQGVHRLIIAVLVLANGAVPRVTVDTDYAPSTISVMFPKSLAHDVSFMFTNVLNPLHWNFSLVTIPHELRGAPQSLLNNPIALQREYLKLKNDPNMKKRRADLRNVVKAGEQNALGMLVGLFGWLDSLEPRGTTEIVTRSQKHEAMSTGLAPIAINSAVSCSPGTRFFFSLSLGIGDEAIVVSKSRRGKKPR